MTESKAKWQKRLEKLQARRRNGQKLNPRQRAWLARQERDSAWKLTATERLSAFEYAVEKDGGTDDME